MKTNVRRLKSFIQFFIGAASIALICYVSLEVTGEVWKHGDDTDWLNAYISNLNWQSLCMILSGCFVLLTMGFPRQAVSFFCGVGFGALQGGLIALLLTVLSACIAYALANGPLRSLAVRLLGTKLKPVENKLAKRSFRNVLIVRLFPVGSNLITNAVAGVLSVPFVPFIAASAIGFAPQTFLFTLLGSGSRFVSSLEQPLQIGGLIISLFLLLSLSGNARRSEPS